MRHGKNDIRGKRRRWAKKKFLDVILGGRREGIRRKREGIKQIGKKK